jgi:hypothetical protein
LAGGDRLRRRLSRDERKGLKAMGVSADSVALLIAEVDTAAPPLTDDQADCLLMLLDTEDEMGALTA